MNSSAMLETARDARSDAETRANTLAAVQREWGSSGQPLKKPTDKNAAYPCGPMNFHTCVDNLFPNSQQLYEMAL
jgi:hypothetical protein